MTLTIKGDGGVNPTLATTLQWIDAPVGSTPLAPLPEYPEPAVERSRFYLPVPLKYAIAMVFALAWLIFSIEVSRPWMEDLGNATHPIFALISLTFIAFAPGFMNAFMIISLLLDRRPARVRPATYPALSILVAAYQDPHAGEHCARALSWRA